MTTFPLEFSKHIIFCIIGTVFFLIQFYRQGYKYQLLTAAAIGITLLLYVNDSNTWRYIVGIVEAILIIIIFIVMSAEKKKAAADEEKKAAEETDIEKPDEEQKKDEQD